MNTLSALILLVTVAVGYSKSDNVCDGSKKIKWVADPSDCSVFYLCFGKLQHKYACEGDTVYNENERMCVEKGSADDKCTKEKPQSLSINDICKRASFFLLPHEDSCSKYIDCTSNTVEECYYPFLFDKEIKRCVPPSIAECGSRYVPKDPCDYVENECRSAQGCVPCSARYPSCVGLTNGLNSWPDREGSPYFVVCKNERVVYHDQCDYERKKEIFHPEKLACVSM